VTLGTLAAPVREATSGALPHGDTFHVSSDLYARLTPARCKWLWTYALTYALEARGVRARGRMMFFDNISDLARALRQDRLRSQDQVYVPVALRDAADPRDWESLDRSLERLGATLHVTAAVPRICLVSMEELGDASAPERMP